MKILLLIIAITIPNLSLAYDNENVKKFIYQGTYLNYVDIAFEHYLEKKSDTKYKFLLLKENYDFSITENKNLVNIDFDFKSKEFKEKTGKTVFGGGAIVVIDKLSNSITSIKMHR